jgi:hypothetical protein
MWPVHDGSVDHAEQVHAQHPFPVALGVLPDQAAMRHAGVVDQQVRHAEALQAQVGQGLHVFGTRDITAQRHHLGAGLAQFGHGGFERVGLHIGQDQVHAARSAQAGQLQAEAAAGARDHGRAAGFEFQCGHGMRSFS